MKKKALRAAAPAPGTHFGAIVAWSEADGLLVTCEGFPGEPRVAVSTVPLSATELEELAARRARVVLAFDSASEQPVVLGIVQSLPSAKPAPVQATVDGERLVLEGQEAIELRCGAASVTLTREGKILIQGTYVSSSSSGAHRIRGASVEVN